MLKGLLSGIALAILVTIGVFSVIGITQAQGEDDPVWRDVSASATTVTVSSTAPTPAPAAPKQTDAYVALGDSVAAGLGLPTWSDATDQDKRCGRSPQSYAFEVGRQLKRPHILYACSGASSGDLFTRQWISNSNPNIQLNQAFSQGTPAVMSITVGANDIGWRELIQRCYSATCGTKAQTDLVDAGLLLMDRNLNRTMDQIKQRSGSTPPTVILTGYYNPVSQQCTAVFGERVTSQEINWIGDGVTKLNQHLQAVADRYSSFVRFAPVDFSGHDLCSKEPWVQGLNDTAPIHPTLAGQNSIARSVVAAAKR
jgi:lysophospholipase L1-like esterase